MKRIRIVHVITGLSIGGAEKVLTRLLSSMDNDAFENHVISLMEHGSLSEEIQSNGINVQASHFDRKQINLVPFMRLSMQLRALKPDLVQTWMYHADLVGGLASRLVNNVPLIWNLRQSNLDYTHSKKSTINTARVCARLSSYVPNTIVCGSEAARDVHSALGYDDTKMVVLYNGFNTQEYRSSAKKREEFRRRLNIPDDAILVGNPSRFDPQKDHETFFNAIASFSQRNPNAHFVLCGDHINWENEELVSYIRSPGLRSKVHLLGVLNDMFDFYSAIDFLVMSSAYGEGAPNTLGEAMSAEVPCVATDVGDSTYIVGETGLVVPPRSPQALSDALHSLSTESTLVRQNRGEQARQRIIKLFPQSTMVQRYEDLYRRVYSQRYDF